MRWMWGKVGCGPGKVVLFRTEVNILESGELEFGYLTDGHHYEVLSAVVEVDL